jgi:hypothetical protein
MTFLEEVMGLSPESAKEVYEDMNTEKTKVYISNDSSPFSGRYVDLELLIEQRDEAHAAYCEFLELYGEADEDTQQFEREYYALDDLIANAETI